MKKTILAGIMSFFFLFNVTSCASEKENSEQKDKKTTTFSSKDVEIRNTESGNMLRGTLYLPDVEGKVPLIITSHELGATGLQPWWVRYAQHWASLGYAVYSFDFAGGGNQSRSDGKTTDMSVKTEASDLEAVLNQARTWDFVDTTKIVLAGGSQGGGVATIVAARHTQEIASLILLYPAYHLPADLQQKYPDRNNLPETDIRNGIITIGRKYILDMYDYNYDNDMRAYNRPVLIVHGDADITAPITNSERALSLFQNAQLHTIKGAGHVFFREAYQEEFLKQADEFLSKHIK